MRVIPPGRKLHNFLLSHCLFKRKTILRKDWDWWTLHTGDEGTGKSTEAIWEAIYTDPTFPKDWRNRIVFEGEGFLTAVDICKRGQSIILDEAGEAWYRLEWWEDTNRALDKAAMQIRYKNLDIHIVAPSLDLVGPQALRRSASRNGNWALVDAPGFVRGNLEVFKGHKSKFGGRKKAMPYWDLRFSHHFLRLPYELYHPYWMFKAEAAEKRLSKYIQTAGRTDDPQMKFRMKEDVLAEVRKLPKPQREKLRNTRGNFDFNLIWHKWGEKGLSAETSRAISRVLSQEFPPRARKVVA